MAEEVKNHLGIDLGGTNIKFVLTDYEGTVIVQGEEPTCDGESTEEGPKWKEAVVNIWNRCKEESKFPVTCGISAPGIADRNRLSIAHMPGRMESLERLNWTEYLESATLIPVMNDAHAALVGEHWKGAAQGKSNVFMLTLGTGVGGAVICDDRLLQGHIGRAGHLGHICLDINGVPDCTGVPGSLENFVSEQSLQHSGCRFKDTKALVQAMSAGDLDAVSIWSSSIRALSCGLTSLINVLDPELIVLGGGIARAGKALFDPLQRELEKVEWRPGGHCVRIAPAELGSWAGAFGGAKVGMDWEINS